jgi:hypothetical protein
LTVFTANIPKVHFTNLPHIESRDSSIGIMTDYGMDDPIIGVGIPEGAGNFSFDTASRPALGLTEPHLQWIAGALSLGVKWSGRDAYHSPPSSVEVRMCGAIPPFPQHSFMAWCAVKKAQGQLYFYLYLALY